MKRLMTTAAILAALSAPVSADEVSDTLQSALDAYNDGDVEYALEELEYAKSLMLEMKTGELSAFLPEAPEGWTREVNTEIGASLAMMGGGVGAEADYRGDGQRLTITLMADNPMVAAMGGMVGNAAAMGAKVERVGRQKFMVQNGEVTGLVDKRILVQAKGGEVETMLRLLSEIDYRVLSDFGR